MVLLRACLFSCQPKTREPNGQDRDANSCGWLQRMLRWLICRNSENTEKPEERKPSGFLLFGSATALASITARKSSNARKSTKKDPTMNKVCAASQAFSETNSVALQRNLRAVLLLRAAQRFMLTAPILVPFFAYYGQDIQQIF